MGVEWVLCVEWEVDRVVGRSVKWMRMKIGRV